MTGTGTGAGFGHALGLSRALTGLPVAPLVERYGELAAAQQGLGIGHLGELLVPPGGRLRVLDGIFAVEGPGRRRHVGAAVLRGPVAARAGSGAAALVERLAGIQERDPAALRRILLYQLVQLLHDHPRGDRPETAAALGIDPAEAAALVRAAAGRARLDAAGRAAAESLEDAWSQGRIRAAALCAAALPPAGGDRLLADRLTGIATRVRDVDALLDEARDCEDRGDLEEAAARYGRAARLAWDCPRAVRGLVRTHTPTYGRLTATLRPAGAGVELRHLPSDDETAGPAGPPDAETAAVGTTGPAGTAGPADRESAGPAGRSGAAGIPVGGGATAAGNADTETAAVGTTGSPAGEPAGTSGPTGGNPAGTAGAGGAGWRIVRLVRGEPLTVPLTEIPGDPVTGPVTDPEAPLGRQVRYVALPRDTPPPDPGPAARAAGTGAVGSAGRGTRVRGHAPATPGGAAGSPAAAAGPVSGHGSTATGPGSPVRGDDGAAGDAGVLVSAVLLVAPEVEGLVLADGRARIEASWLRPAGAVGVEVTVTGPDGRTVPHGSVIPGFTAAGSATAGHPASGSASSGAAGSPGPAAADGAVTYGPGRGTADVGVGDAEQRAGGIDASVGGGDGGEGVRFGGVAVGAHAVRVRARYAGPRGDVLSLGVEGEVTVHAWPEPVVALGARARDGGGLRLRWTGGAGADVRIVQWPGEAPAEGAELAADGLPPALPWVDAAGAADPPPGTLATVSAVAVLGARALAGPSTAVEAPRPVAGLTAHRTSAGRARIAFEWPDDAGRVVVATTTPEAGGEAVEHPVVRAVFLREGLELPVGPGAVRITAYAAPRSSLATVAAPGDAGQFLLPADVAIAYRVLPGQRRMLRRGPAVLRVTLLAPGGDPGAGLPDFVLVAGAGGGAARPRRPADGAELCRVTGSELAAAGTVEREIVPHPPAAGPYAVRGFLLGGRAASVRLDEPSLTSLVVR
ncbi:hypothetical protein HYE82_19205 [Streptomyces sp. BR123]|uniref:hypothetical protein n=1 Tax=Streptomyces sp. BR123 TaxID=2749828 RepID=UPI0015C438DE|nr:hypothetical protein [Streptomyces sp. BR123]NXY96480.1 hypothetical protein [Streptomyces sp. BR123]